MFLQWNNHFIHKLCPPTNRIKLNHLLEESYLLCLVIAFQYFNASQHIFYRDVRSGHSIKLAIIARIQIWISHWSFNWKNLLHYFSKRLKHIEFQWSNRNNNLYEIITFSGFNIFRELYFWFSLLLLNNGRQCKFFQSDI